jgi:hypothetical protein
MHPNSPSSCDFVVLNGQGQSRCQQALHTQMHSPGIANLTVLKPRAGESEKRVCMGSGMPLKA